MDTEMKAVRDGAGGSWVAAANAEYRRWGTGGDSRRPPGERAWACRQNDNGSWLITTYHRNEREADEARHEQALAAAIGAVLAAPSAAGGEEMPGDLGRVPEAYREKVRAVLGFTDEDWLLLRACFPEVIEQFRQVIAAAPSSLQGSDTGGAGRDPTGPGHARAEPSGLGPEAECPSRSEILTALAPFARAARGIPDDLPDDLWTHCKSYPWDMSQQDFDAMRARGVPLLSRETELSLWMDGHPLSDFRQAARVYDAVQVSGGALSGVDGLCWRHPAPDAAAPHSPGPGYRVMQASGSDPRRWTLSEEALAHIRDIELTTVHPGDPRLRQTLIGPAGPAIGMDGYGSQARPLAPASCDGSGEAGETGTGSTEGNSAVGRQAETPRLKEATFCRQGEEYVTMVPVEPAPPPTAPQGADLAGLSVALDAIDVHAEAQRYEFRDPDYSPADHERAMLEDFGNHLLSAVADRSAALVPTASAPSVSTGDRGMPTWFPNPKTPVDALAVALLAEFQRVEPDHPISRHPASWVSTFVDLARVALAHPGSVAPTSGEREDRRERARAIAEAAANRWDAFNDTAGIVWLAEQILGFPVPPPASRNEGERPCL